MHLSNRSFIPAEGMSNHSRLLEPCHDDTARRSWNLLPRKTILAKVHLGSEVVEVPHQCEILGGPVNDMGRWCSCQLVLAVD